MTDGDLHKNGKFEKMGNWARIHQRYGKTSNEVTKKVDFDKYGECAKKIIKGLAKYSHKMTKKDILTNSDFSKMTNLAKIYLRFGKN